MKKISSLSLLALDKQSAWSRRGLSRCDITSRAVRTGHKWAEESRGGCPSTMFTHLGVVECEGTGRGFFVR